MENKYILAIVVGVAVLYVAAIIWLGSYVSDLVSNSF